QQISMFFTRSLPEKILTDFQLIGSMVNGYPYLCETADLNVLYSQSTGKDFNRFSIDWIYGEWISLPM
ncbi:hypothetical protein BOQ60_26680, partial [Chryseobacterium sp. CH1]